MSLMPKERMRRIGRYVLTSLTLMVLVYAIAFCQFVPRELETTDLDCLRREFGWPVAFVHETQRSGLYIPFNGVTSQYVWVETPNTEKGRFWLCLWSRPWPWEYELVKVSKPALCLDVFCWMAVVAFAVTALEFRCRRPGSRLQISLGELLMLTAAMATLFAVLPYTGLQNWLNPHWISDGLNNRNDGTIDGTITVSLTPVNSWQDWCVWAPECTLVALILCFGLACACYAAGMLLFRVVHGAVRVVTQRMGNRNLTAAPGS